MRNDHHAGCFENIIQRTDQFAFCRFVHGLSPVGRDIVSRRLQ